MKVRYAVYDNGTPARFPEKLVPPEWDNCEFDTIEEARAYAQEWLGDTHHLPQTWDGHRFYYNEHNYIVIYELRQAHKVS